MTQQYVRGTARAKYGASTIADTPYLVASDLTAALLCLCTVVLLATRFRVQMPCTVQACASFSRTFSSSLRVALMPSGSGSLLPSYSMPT